LFYQKRKLVILIAMFFYTVLVYGHAKSQIEFDIVLRNGRVMDPDTGLDAIRDIGISGKRITVVSDSTLVGKEIIDVSGLVVAPGFIDLHAHGQDMASNRLQVADGVTTALELELGVYPVGEWLRSRQGHALINYGATVGHWNSRVKILDDVDVTHMLSLTKEDRARIFQDKGVYEEASTEQIAALLAMFKQGLAEGALGIGLGLDYTPGASHQEILSVFKLAAEQETIIFIHMRHSEGIFRALQEVFSNVVVTNAATHIVHLNSSSGDYASQALEMIRSAREQGLDITTEAYPYTAGASLIESAIFDHLESNEMSDEAFRFMEWPKTGERLTASTFRKYRDQGGLVIIHGRKESVSEWLVAQPDVLVASDGISFASGPAHPRGAGTFSRILGYYSRERGVITLMDALKKMTLLPAQRLESVAPQMKNKGRMQAGFDADITIFDPASIIDRATYRQGGLTSLGVIHVLVNGKFVIRNTALVEGVFPGQAVVGVTK